MERWKEMAGVQYLAGARRAQVVKLQVGGGAIVVGHCSGPPPNVLYIKYFRVYRVGSQYLAGLYWRD